jgi:signal transduction histidine kinase
MSMRPASQPSQDQGAERLADADLAAKLARLEQLEKCFQETLEAEKLEALAEFAAGAGHEINNPLAIIGGRAQLLLRDEKDPERRRELALIAAQVKRAHEMIADVRLFARSPRPEFQTTDLAALVREVLDPWRPVAQDRAIELIAPKDIRPLECEADPTQIAVAVAAVVRNAIEAIGREGRIEVSLHHVSLHGTADAVGVRIRDNGPGILPEHRRHLFDPFFSARQAGRGLGMGLSKCWRIVTNHGGSVAVESEPGGGATFTLTLPRKQAAHEP